MFAFNTKTTALTPALLHQPSGLNQQVSHYCCDCIYSKLYKNVGWFAQTKNQIGLGSGKKIMQMERTRTLCECIESQPRPTNESLHFQTSIVFDTSAINSPQSNRLCAYMEPMFS